MRRHAFALAILGIFTLLLLQNLPAKQLNSIEQLNSFQQNQKLLIKGIIEKETYTKNSKVLHLNNEIQLHCPNPCQDTYLNSSINAVVKLEKYNNKIYLKILSIKENSKN